jgi:hypothetical protein
MNSNDSEVDKIMDTIQKNDFKNDQQNQRGHLNP